MMPNIPQTLFLQLDPPLADCARLEAARVLIHSRWNLRAMETKHLIECTVAAAGPASGAVVVVSD